MQLVHLASRIYGTPLLIARSKLDIILSVLGSRIGLANPGIAPPLPSAQSEPTAVPGIAVIPIHGTLVRRTVGLEAASGLLSYDEIAARIDTAIQDPEVQGILLDVDSPGGEAGGVFDLAERIRAADRVKPVWAIANDSAFSAAYALACAGSRLLLTRTAGVGSIGVIALHVDQSVKDAQDGLHYTAVYAGSRKNDFSPHAPLSSAALANLQAEVDRLHGLFIAHVAGMRDLSEDAARATEAALYFGEQALDAGLADGVSTRDQALSDFSAFLHAAQTMRARAGSPPIHARTSTPNPLPRMENTMPDDIPAEPHPVQQNPATPAASAAVTPATEPVQTPSVDAQAVAEMCLLAGSPERTAEFLAARMTEAQVRRCLLEARANQPEIASRLTPDAHTQSPSQPQSSPVIAAVKKRIHKE